MKRIRLTALFLAFFLLAACAQPLISPESSVPAGPSTPPSSDPLESPQGMPGSEELMLISLSGEDEVYTAAGKCILQAAKGTLTLLRDTETKEVRFIQQQHPEKTGEDEYGYPIIQTTYSRYAPDGTLLADHVHSGYAMVWGDFATVICPPDYTMQLVSLSTGETLPYDFDYCDLMAGGFMLVNSRERYVQTVTPEGDSAGILYDVDSAYVTGSGGLPSVFIYHTENGMGIADFSCRPIYTSPSASVSSIAGPYAVVTEEGELPCSRVLDLTTGEELFSLEGHLPYFDGERYLSQTVESVYREELSYSSEMLANQILGDAALSEEEKQREIEALHYEDSYVVRLGTIKDGVLPTAYDFVNTYEFDGEPLFVATQYTGLVEVFDGQFQLLFSLPFSELDFYLTPLSSDRFLQVFYGWDEINNQSLGGFRLLDAAGSVVFEKENYTFASTFYDQNGHHLDQIWAGYQPANSIAVIYDLLDRNGNVIADHLKNVVYLQNGYYAAERGFSYGVFDTEGNWLFQNSIFSRLDDDEYGYYY